MARHHVGNFMLPITAIVNLNYGYADACPDELTVGSDKTRAVA